MIKAVIFDMDGLMFNTEAMFKILFREVLDQNHILAPESIVEAMIGCDSRRVQIFEQEYPGITETMAYCQKHRMEYFFSMFKEPGSANMPGLQELIAYLDQQKIPYAIASSSAPEDIRRMVEHAGFKISYKVLTSSKEGIPSKPAPDIFLETAKRLNVDPKNCLVLEDSKNGIIAAAGAHMHSIFVPDQIVPDEEMKPYIQTTCQSLKDVIPYLENQPAMV